MLTADPKIVFRFLQVGACLALVSSVSSDRFSLASSPMGGNIAFSSSLDLENLGGGRDARWSSNFGRYSGAASRAKMVVAAIGVCSRFW